MKIGFLINPIAGMGGRVGLKGTDGVLELAIARGATPSAGRRAGEMLASLRERLAKHPAPPAIEWVTGGGALGEEALREAGFEAIEVVCEPSGRGDAGDTRRCVRAFLEAGATLVLFCGGDGTARDVCGETGRSVPMLGIPAGVKMYSAVFGLSPSRSAEILVGYLDGRLGRADADVLDVDEEAFRQGILRVRLYDEAITPHEPHLVQCAKQVIADLDEGHAKAEIAEHLAEEIEARPETLILLGPGSTVASLAKRIGVAKTVLGVDALLGGELVGRDLCENQLLALLDAYPRARLVVSPLGAQGFALGRGNPQLSPSVIRRIGRDAIVLVATPTKLAGTRALHFDTGDASLDAELVGDGFLPVVTGYHVRRLVAVEI